MRFPIDTFYVRVSCAVVSFTADWNPSVGCHAILIFRVEETTIYRHPTRSMWCYKKNIISPEVVDVFLAEGWERFQGGDQGVA